MQKGQQTFGDCSFTWSLSKGLRNGDMKSHCLNSTEVLPCPQVLAGTKDWVRTLFKRHSRVFVSFQCPFWATPMNKDKLPIIINQGNCQNSCMGTSYRSNSTIPNMTGGRQGQNKRKYDGLIATQPSYLLFSRLITGKLCLHGSFVLPGSSSVVLKKIRDLIFMLSCSLWTLIGDKAARNKV